MKGKLLPLLAVAAGVGVIAMSSRKDGGSKSCEQLWVPIRAGYQGWNLSEQTVKDAEAFFASSIQAEKEAGEVYVSLIGIVQNFLALRIKDCDWTKVIEKMSEKNKADEPLNKSEQVVNQLMKLAENVSKGL